MCKFLFVRLACAPVPSACPAPLEGKQSQRTVRRGAAREPSELGTRGDERPNGLSNAHCATIAAVVATGNSISFVSDPRTGVALGVTRGRNMRSKYPCSTCPAIHINSRTWLRSSSTREPSDPPPELIFHFSISRPTLRWVYRNFDNGFARETGRTRCPGSVLSLLFVCESRAARALSPRPGSLVAT